MSNPANYIALVVQCFLEDDALSAKFDGNIVPGFQRVSADKYLDPAKNPTECCLGIRTLNLNESDLGGCAYHGLSDYDQLIEFDLIHVAYNDTYAWGAAAEIMRRLKSPLTNTIGGVSYSVTKKGTSLKFTPVNDPAFPTWIELTATFEIGYIDS
jgi:hypothetical protein